MSRSWRAVLVVALLAACSGGAGSQDEGQGTDGAGEQEQPSSTADPQAPDPQAPDPQAPATPGCGSRPEDVDQNRLLHRQISSEGGDRRYMIYVPDSYTGEQPVPVVFVFHGAGSSKEEQLVYSGFGPRADEHGFVSVYPDALGEPTLWSPFGVQRPVDDLGFFEDLLEAVEGEICVDTARIYASGMSSGGFMATAVACRFSDRIAAVAPVTATAYINEACQDAEPVPWIYFHGTDDPVVPFLGPIPGPEGEPGPGSVETSAERWAEHNGCGPEPSEERIGDDVIHRWWTGCDAATHLYIVEGGGHTWPGAIDVASLGRTTHTVEATELIWELFSSSTRPA